MHWQTLQRPISLSPFPSSFLLLSSVPGPSASFFILHPSAEVSPPVDRQSKTDRERKKKIRKTRKTGIETFSNKVATSYQPV
jgi:hypothetical protein